MLQNCPVFNDGVWEGVKDDPAGKQIVLAEGKPLVFAGGTKGIRLGAGLVPEIVDVVGGDTERSSLVAHREAARRSTRTSSRSSSSRTSRCRWASSTATTSRRYEQLANQQVDDAIAKQGPGDLTKLMYSGMVWEVGADGTRH